MLLLCCTTVLLSIVALNAKSESESTQFHRAVWNYKAIEKHSKVVESQSGNPFLYPCTSNSQCSTTPGVNTCHMSPPNQPNKWFCDCFWYTTDTPCRNNKDCCTNICHNGQCSTTGGTQGTLCSSQHQDCAPGFTCVPWGDVGYCNGGTLTTTIRTTTTTAAGHNPYIYPCTTNHDCLFGTDNCVQTGCPTGVGLLDPSGWHCDCWTSSGGPPCDHDGDCCSNICGSDGFCEQGGRDGAVCMDCWGTTWDGACAAGCQCIPFEGYGYCQC